MNKDFVTRKELRLTHYDYSSPGAYFITICTHNRKETLAHVVGAIHESPDAQLTRYGEIVNEVIKSLPSRIGVSYRQVCNNA